MKLPSLCELSVDLTVIDSLNQKLEEYKLNEDCWIPRDSSATRNGIQTFNLLTFEDNDLNNVLHQIKIKLEKDADHKLEYYWVHLIEYDSGGFQLPHTHDHNEDFSFVLYLNDCVDGNTTFILNEKRNVIKSFKPTQGLGVFFLASMLHYADVCTTNKKVLVCGLRVQ